MSQLSVMYVNGKKMFLESPRSMGPECGYSGFTPIRLRDTPDGPVVSEHQVPRRWLAQEGKTNVYTGGNWYSIRPDHPGPAPVIR